MTQLIKIHGYRCTVLHNGERVGIRCGIKDGDTWEDVENKVAEWAKRHKDASHD